MHLHDYYASFVNPYGFKFFAPILLIVAIWTIVWKGMALWRAGRNGDKVWFVVLLLVNTLGILEILYLYKFGKPKSQPLQ